MWLIRQLIIQLDMLLLLLYDFALTAKRVEERLLLQFSVFDLLRDSSSCFELLVLLALIFEEAIDFHDIE